MKQILCITVDFTLPKIEKTENEHTHSQNILYSSYGIKQKEQLKCINCSVETCFALFFCRAEYTLYIRCHEAKHYALLKAETKNPFDSQLHGKNKPEIKLTKTQHTHTLAHKS